MPSSEQPPGSNKVKGSKGTFRRKMAEIINPSKNGSKIGSKMMNSRSSYACTTTRNDFSDQDKHDKTNPASCTDNVVVEAASENLIVDNDSTDGSSSHNIINSTITTNVSIEQNDDNQTPTPISPAEQKTSNSTFLMGSRINCTTTSSSHQRLHRQITRTSEMKTSCVKSDLSDLKASFLEMKNLTKLNNSFEDTQDKTTGIESSQSSSTIHSAAAGDAAADPVITYPDSPQPNSTINITCFPASSRKNSVAIEEMRYTNPLCATSSSSTVNDAMKFEQKRAMATASSRSKMMTGQRQYIMQTGNPVEKSLDTRHEQRMTSENITHQQSQNVSSSSMKLHTDSYSAGKIQAAQQQRKISTSSSSSGQFNEEKLMSNFSTKKEFSTSSVSKLMNSNFLTNEVDAAVNLERQSLMAEYLNETFSDLANLDLNATQQDVEQAVTKYSNQMKLMIDILKDGKTTKVAPVLDKLSEMMAKAWLVPTHGHALATKLCDQLRTSGGLDLLITNCDSKDEDIKFSSAMLLEMCLTTENRAHVVDNGLEKVVEMASSFTHNAKSPDHSRISTGILSHLLKHSESTCENVIRLGGLDTVIYECRNTDVKTLRNCASALANLSLYGGAENQDDMMKRNVPIWLFPLAFNPDEYIKYYACLTIAVLVANKEMEASVLQSGTLNLVEPFVTSHNPYEFAKSNLAHRHGQSQNWLQKLVPVLSSKRPEARNLAAFHFCMEAGIKKSQGNSKVFHEIGAIESLKKVASCPNAIASKFAAQALKLIGENVPHKLIQQVPLWSVEDVKQWIIQIGFLEYSNNFEQSRVDGDLLLQLTEENLKEDIGINNGIRRRRFTRELQNLKKLADYSSRDVHNLNHFLQKIGPEFTAYTYDMLNAGVDKDYLKLLSQEQLLYECGITNSIHRLRILENIKSETTLANTFQQEFDKPLDVFISYRRSNGSQLASLLKVHLQVRNFTVFLDVEKLEAGKFDNNILQSIKQASNFILVLTPNALDRCINDPECKDWIHREIVAALHSHCNIIPITDNFQWPEPEQLPEDMRAICRFNGIKWVHDYQDACVEKVERFIKGEVNSRNVYQELAITSPHGARSVRDVKSSPTFQRAQSIDICRDTEAIKDQ